MTDRTAAAPARAAFSGADLAALVICTLVWGTTWYAITLQFGVVAPTVSVVYRFAIAAAALMAFALATRAPLRLDARQHAAAFGMGLATFAVQYPLVYEAETHLASAIVAVLFAAMAFVNLVVFRLIFGERASGVAWLAAALGIAGVALLSWGELSATQMDRSASWGLLVCAGAILAASLGNASARAAQTQGASVIASTAWAMTYGAGALALYALASGAEWSFDPRPTYILSLIYLAVFGSVVAFLLYFGLARRRGFAAASYISALTPPVAMVVSTVFESKAWTALTLFGVAVIVAGQWLLSRIPRA